MSLNQLVMKNDGSQIVRVLHPGAIKTLEENGRNLEGEVVTEFESPDTVNQKEVSQEASAN